VEVISTAIGNMMKAEFTALQDSHGTGILPVDGVTISDWEQQTFLASGSLISSGCMAALMLASHSDMLQQQAYEFGKQVALAYEVCGSAFCSSLHSLSFISVVSRDVLYFTMIGFSYFFKIFLVII